MKSITANTPFRAFAPVFTLQGPPATEVTISVSVDGTNFTDLDDTFTGAQIFKDYATNTFLKCSSDVLISDDNVEFVKPTEYVQAHLPQGAAGGRLVIEKVPGQQQFAVPTTANPVEYGTAVWFKFVPTSSSTVDENGKVTYHSQRFNYWKDGFGNFVSDENPYFVVVYQNTNLTADITEY